VSKQRNYRQKRVPQSIIDKLLADSSLLDLIKESLRVVHHRGHHRAICPFHASNNAVKSLTIDTDDQKFSCDECGFQGSAIGWLMYHDALSFQESLLVLAEKADIDVSKWIDRGELVKERKKNLSLFNNVTSFYQRELAESDHAQHYLESRGLDESTVKRFKLGYAPRSQKSFDSRFSYYGRTLWTQGHLIRRSDGSFSQRFWDRLMIPIMDIDGNTIGFGGRAFSEGSPKYLNSPSSALFDKSKTVFGLHQALESSTIDDPFILVEGYMDVMTLSQYGITNAVATLGTAPSEHHIRDIYTHTQSLVVCFDGDVAGQQAAERLLNIALPCLSDGDQLFFSTLPPGHDPDSIVREFGAEAFNALIRTAKPVDTFLHDYLSARFDTDSIGGKAALAAAASPMIQSIESAQLRHSAIDIFEHTIGVPCFNSAQSS